MPILKNSRHERFAQSLAAGKTATDAYIEAGYQDDDGHACRLAGNGRIRARVEEILGKAAARVEFTKADAIETLVEIIEADPNSADGTNAISELRMSKCGPFYVNPDKLAALNALARMLGWNAPEEQKHSFDLTPEQLENLSNATSGARAANAAMGIGSTESKP